MRRARALLVVPVLVLLLPAGPARAQAPDAQGWWTTLHQAGAPAPPAPPDVAVDDLLLQGGDVARALPDTGQLDRSPAPTALAALRFAVPSGAAVGPLVLTVAAGAQAADVRAYPTSSTWVPAQGGAAQDAPVVDLSRYSQGVLSADGATLAFADIGRLVPEEGELSVVLVPGPLDRVVVHHPGPAALQVTGGQVIGCFCVPPPVPGPAPPPVGVATAPVVPAVLSGPPAPVAAPAVVPPPVVTVPTAAQPVSQAVRRVVADDARTRVLVGLEALLVLAAFGLLGQGPLARLAALTGTPREVRAARGVGRFVQERAGRPPQL